MPMKSKRPVAVDAWVKGVCKSVEYNKVSRQSERKSKKDAGTERAREIELARSPRGGRQTDFTETSGEIARTFIAAATSTPSTTSTTTSTVDDVLRLTTSTVDGVRRRLTTSTSIRLASLRFSFLTTRSTSWLLFRLHSSLLLIRCCIGRALLLNG